MSLTPSSRVELRDAEAMRALAHPARASMLARLAFDGPATATQCAEVTGLSPSACSWHLRALARWGLVEEDPGGSDRRERRWRAVSTGWEVAGAVHRGDDPEKAAAARLLRSRALERHQDVLLEFLRQEQELDPAWRESTTVSGIPVHVTAEELARLGEELRAVIEPYIRADPAGRPQDARRAFVMTYAVPWSGY